MAILAFMGDLKDEQNARPPEAVRKAYAFIRTHAKPDGGIYGNGLSVYNTALCLNSLLLDDDRRSHALIPGAKRFLENHQSGLELRVESGDGPDGAGALLNLSTALESLRQSEESAKQNGSEGLDFDAAMKFLEQSKKPAAPGSVPRGETNDADPARGAGVTGKARGPHGRVALRGSGDMTYDGLLSLIYAPMEGGDPRLDAFLGWLQENYSIEENPGLGQQGLFYYYHSMAKVLSLRKIERLKLKDGTEVDWRRDLARKILTAQQKDGSWVNRNGRWWENDPFLVSSYALLTLQQLGPGL
jgi:squalene-hopene/tetraprenyl-beta-curcumene cyclase